MCLFLNISHDTPLSMAFTFEVKKSCGVKRVSNFVIVKVIVVDDCLDEDDIYDYDGGKGS